MRPPAAPATLTDDPCMCAEEFHSRVSNRQKLKPRHVEKAYRRVLAQDPGFIYRALLKSRRVFRMYARTCHRCSYTYLITILVSIERIQHGNVITARSCHACTHDVHCDGSGGGYLQLPTAVDEHDRVSTRT